MSQRLPVVFCGSFLEYSSLVLAGLHQHPALEIVAVITTPPQPQGRDKKLTKTAVHTWAEAADLPVFTPAVLDEAALAALPATDFLLTAGYGKLLPTSWLAYPRIAALNLHFSLLPKYRGANPAEWALLRGETTSGVSVIEMSPEFDTGHVVSTTELAINPRETRETLYQRLYELGGDVLPEVVTRYQAFRQHQAPAELAGTKLFFPPHPQGASPTPYAKRLTRDDGFVGWAALRAAQTGQPAPLSELSPQLQAISQSAGYTSTVPPSWLELAVRALTGFPGIWSKVQTTKGEKRLKIISAHLEKNATAGECLVPDQVQLEGQAASRWQDIKNAIQ